MKKRILSLLLAFVMVAGMFPTQSLAEEISDACPVCKEIGCVLNHSTTASEDATESASETTETCETCGTSPCTCDEVTDICLIGYLDKTNNDTISFYNPSREEKTVDVSKCPDYLILTQKTVKKSLTTDEAGNTQLVETAWYQTDSLNNTFWSDVVSSYATTEAKNFAAVTSAAGLYATLSGAELTLYKDISVATDAKSAVLTGEYVVADFCVDGTLGWLVKLTPDASWPADAEGYVWTSAFNLVTLTRTPTRQPEVPECTCGQEQHTSECPLYESPFSDIEDEEARAAVQAFADYMAAMPTQEMLTFYKSYTELGLAWGKIPLDSSDKPEEEQAAFDAALEALTTAMNSTSEDLGADVNDSLMGMAEAFYAADDLLPQGMEAYLSTADSELLETYNALVVNLKLGIETYRGPQASGLEVIGDHTPNIQISLFNYNSDINSHGFYKFQMNGDTDFEEDTGASGTENQGNPVFGNLVNGYPYVTKFIDSNGNTITGEGSGSLDYLFGGNPNNGVTDCPVAENGRYLFTQSGNKYTYDSRKNAAVYNDTNDSLTAYNWALRPSNALPYFSGMGQFLPFNGDVLYEDTPLEDNWGDWWDVWRAYQLTNGTGAILDWNTGAEVAVGAVDETAIDQTVQIAGPGLALKGVPNLYGLNGREDNRVDLAFGMMVEFVFYVTPDGKIYNADGTVEDIIFNFMGDDDVVVYIDDVPVLNIGGPRGITRGTIDFTDGGTATVYEEYCSGNGTDHDETHGGTSTADGDHLAEDYRQVPNVSQLLQDNGIRLYDNEHTLRFFYLERWGGASNCVLEFTMPVVPDTALYVTKQEEGLNTGLQGQTDYTFVVRDENGNPLANTVYTSYGVSYTTDEYGHFPIKHGKTVYFPVKHLEKFTVEEVVPTNSPYTTEYSVYYYDANERVEKTRTGSGTSTGEIQVFTDVRNEATFTNTYQTGSLEITKQLNPVGAQESTRDTFNFFVTVPEGVTEGAQFTYTVDGETKTTTVSGGKLTVPLAPGKTARFEGLIAGTVYKVEEDSNYINEGYSASYDEDGDSTTIDDGVVTIVANDTVGVVCTNSFPVGSVTINKTVEKEFDGDPLDNPTFTFTLTKTDGTPLVDGKKYKVISNGKTTDYTVANNKIEVQLSFTDVGSKSVKIDELPTGTYQVVESGPDGFTQTYQINNGTAQTGTTAAGIIISQDQYTHTVNFTNTLKRYTGSLQISKNVSLVGNATQTVTDFDFDIIVPAGVTGTYTYTVGEDSREATVTGDKLTISIQNGQTATFVDLPIGVYTVAEHNYADMGYSASYVDNSGTTTDGVVTVTKGGTATVSCKNAFPVGSITITKTVSKENSGDTWSGDTFAFVISRTDGTALVDGTSYPVYAGTTLLDTKTVVNGTLTVEITFDKEGTRAIKIDELPQGSYQVVESLSENQAKAYNTEPANRTQTTSISPDDYAGEVSFTNKLKRHIGNLEIQKTVDVETGATAPDAAQSFTFTVTLDADAPAGTYTVNYALIDSTEITKTEVVTITEGAKSFAVSLVDGQKATILGLPIGGYSVTETPVEGFEPSWTGNTGTIENGQTATVKCTNRYPVYTGKLEITKIVTKAYARDTWTGDTFTFLVTPATGVTLIQPSYIYYVGSEKKIATNSDNTLTVELPVTALNTATTLVIMDLPIGSYTVTETVTNDYTALNNNLSVDVSGATTAEVSFTNTYKQHLGTLTITKWVTGSNLEDTFIFHITGNGVDMDATITTDENGNGSVKIHDLPLGSYTVTEDTDWSWRYNLTDSNTKDNVITLDHLHANVTFKNEYKTNQWLNYFTNKLNEFGKSN